MWRTKAKVKFGQKFDNEEGGASKAHDVHREGGVNFTFGILHLTSDYDYL